MQLHWWEKNIWKGLSEQCCSSLLDRWLDRDQMLWICKTIQCIRYNVQEGWKDLKYWLVFYSLQVFTVGISTWMWHRCLCCKKKKGYEVICSTLISRFPSIPPSLRCFFTSISSSTVNPADSKTQICCLSLHRQTVIAWEVCVCVWESDCVILQGGPGLCSTDVLAFFSLAQLP